MVLDTLQGTGQLPQRTPGPQVFNVPTPRIPVLHTLVVSLIPCYFAVEDPAARSPRHVALREVRS